METTWYSWLFGAAYLSAIIAFAVVVIMTRRPVGVSLAWLVLLFALPVAGFVLYLLLGSPRLGIGRLKRMHALYPDYAQWYQHLARIISGSEPSCCPVTSHHGIFSLAEKSMSIPLLPGNHLQLFSGFANIIEHLLRDIENARQSVVIEFYIWEPVGRAVEVAEAVIRASRRGVDCLVVLDNVGSRGFLNGIWTRRFRLEGISVTASMSAGPLRMLVERIDIRNHRKILVVDDQVAWTGSFNLVDPSLFKQEAQVGQWVDAMVRIDGVAAHVLAAIVQWDIALETGQGHPSFNRQYEYPTGGHRGRDGAFVHVLPSGPDADRTILQQVLLTAIYESRQELLISTPYFVPDEALLTALKSAAMRGVDVQLLVPEKNDSKMVYHASRSYYQELLQAGVTIQQFRGGLLHTKCVLVDRETALFGTVNLDMRSVWLNYEVTLIIYDDGFGQQIFHVLQSYINQAGAVDSNRWSKRPFRQKLLENTLQLLSPLL
ncbi:cardiolipin synthase [Endozoicomonas sp. ONNA2]|uniref:cardiolipin synthase n=1 Tax=Endozoicomonas sp. ONNA2 TaxID=2828741 RepID=UPI0021489596|nr:cardiolipin synthase [Endozoicomonas sp. ONNA2]